jgi:hypothetical protein
VSGAIMHKRMWRGNIGSTGVWVERSHDIDVESSPCQIGSQAESDFFKYQSSSYLRLILSYLYSQNLQKLDIFSWIELEEKVETDAWEERVDSVESG